MKDERKKEREGGKKEGKRKRERKKEKEEATVHPFTSSLRIKQRVLSSFEGSSTGLGLKTM